MGMDSRGKINNDVSVRTRFEFGLQSGNNGGGTQFVNQGGTSSKFAVRHLDVIVESKKFGAVWIGRGDSSSNGSAEVQTIAAIDSGRLGGRRPDLISALSRAEQELERGHAGSGRGRRLLRDLRRCEPPEPYPL